MPRYKAFFASSVTAVTRMEHEINEWMESVHPRILHMTQSASEISRSTGSNEFNMVVSFVYDFSESESLGTATAATAIPEAFERTLEETQLDPTIDRNDILLPEAELPY